MAEWLTHLATTAASTLVAAAASDVWRQARSGIVALFTRAGRTEDVIVRWSDETVAAIGAAPPTELDAVKYRLVTVWITRVADLLNEFPEFGEELRGWEERVRPLLPSRQTWMQNFSAHGNSIQYNAPHGTITVNDPRGGRTGVE
jgi:hypothetical protein